MRLVHFCIERRKNILNNTPKEVIMRTSGKILFGTVLTVVSLYLIVQLLNRPTAMDDQAVPIPVTAYQKDDNLPQINIKDLKNVNNSEALTAELHRRYGPVQYSGVSVQSSTLTPEETERYKICVKNGPRDRGHNGSKFWGKEENIRRLHHTYLKKDNAVMIEVGGNKGNDAEEFVKLYNPRYLILEPLEEYANLLKERFKNNPKVTVINLGLGTRNEVALVKIEGANACATSKFSGAGGETPLFLTNATEFLMKAGVGLFDIDLLTMNCEGCEYEALEAILGTSLIKNIRNIQFATHSTITGLKEPIERYCRNQELLSRTHRPTYQYKFIWESWRRKDLS